MIENDIKEKEIERIILNLQVKEFLAKGGQIKQYPYMPDLKPKDLIDIYAERYQYVKSKKNLPYEKRA